MMSESKYDINIRMRFFALSWMLETLSDTKALEQLNRLRLSLRDRRHETGLLVGYKLIVETMLYRQIELIVAWPEILHLRADDALQLWWLNTDQKSPRRLKGFVSSVAPDSTFVANHINDLLLRMVRAGNRWDRFADASTDVQSYAAMLLSLSEDCHVVFLRDEGADSVPDTRHVLRVGGAECLHDFVFDSADTTLTAAWDYTRASIDEWLKPRTPVVHWMSDVETSKDTVSTVLRRRRSADEFIVTGLNAAIAITSGASTNVNSTISERVQVAPPDEKLFGGLRREFRTGRWPSLRYGISFNGELPENAIRNLMSFEESLPDPRERLKDLLGDSAFLAGGASNSPELHFEALVRGLAAALPEDRRVEVLKIAHKPEPIKHLIPLENEPHVLNPHPPVSLAVRVGGDWHVFYSLDAVGRMKSSVWRLLDDLSDRVDVEEIEDVCTKFLLRICDRAFQYVAHQWKSQRDLNAHLRGSIPELLAGLLLVRSGCFPAKINVGLNRSTELDAVGYTHADGIGECRVVEVKKQSTNQIQLRWEIERFKEKIDSIREDSSAVAKELGIPVPIERVTGIFISMARLGTLDHETPDESDLLMDFHIGSDPKPAFKEFLDGLEGVEFWDYDRFNRELAAVDMSKLPVRLLEEAAFVWIMNDGEESGEFDGWSSLANAVEREDWQELGSHDSVKDTLEKNLRDKHSQVGPE